MDTHPSGALRPALLSILVVAALALTTAPASAAPAQSGASSKAVAMAMRSPALAPSTYEKRVQRWINKERRQRNLAPLRFARCADRTAERWSGHLARNNAFHHQSMQRVLKRCNARYAGETLGRGAIWPKRLVRMWMESDGHRHVLLSPNARRIGIGAKPDVHGRWVTAANFVRF
jgi:uncharacterized protein YkwD